LVEHCRSVATTKRKAYQDEKYWGKPVPDFGSPDVGLLVVGLAPGAHGANRTGRMFTGDRSGEWLYRAMYRAGFANQPTAIARGDGLELIDCAVTNICRCAPPGNKPLPIELKNCRPYFDETLRICNPIVVLTLGALAWNATIPLVVEHQWLERPKKRPKFSHGGSVKLNDGRWLLGSYHPSQQNTFTGRLTESMLDAVFRQARKRIQKYRAN
jgi:uracil-DNA glycosylase family 4